MTKGEREQFDRLLARLDAHEETIKGLNEILPTLKALAEAWEAAGWFGRAIKWIGGVVGAIVAISIAIKLGFTHK